VLPHTIERETIRPLSAGDSLHVRRRTSKGVLRVRTELPLEAAADGHTASLFSAPDIERARERLAIAVQRPDGMSAVSVTPQFLAQVAEPLFVVAGDGKRAALGALAAQDPNLTAWRAVQGCPQVELWVYDAGAMTATS